MIGRPLVGSCLNPAIQRLRWLQDKEFVAACDYTYVYVGELPQRGECIGLLKLSDKAKLSLRKIILNPLLTCMIEIGRDSLVLFDDTSLKFRLVIKLQEAHFRPLLCVRARSRRHKQHCFLLDALKHQLSKGHYVNL